MIDMRTKDEIIIEMVDAMPFHLDSPIVPYIKEALDIYAKEALKAASDNAKVKLVRLGKIENAIIADSHYFHDSAQEVTVDKESITNIELK